MRIHLPLASALLLSSLAALVAAPSTGCAPGNGEDVSVAEQATTGADLALAAEIVDLLGGEQGKCKQCHGITATRLRAWGTAMKDVETACFAPATLTPAERVNCLRTVTTSATSPFSARRLGLYAAGVNSDAFKDLFESAFPPATWSSEFATFAQRAAMPRGGEALTPDEFAKVKGWVLRGMPQLDQAFGSADGGADAATDADAATARVCVPSTTPALATHLAAMKTTGWGARLADQATPMFGCGAAATPLDCLTQLPDATQTFGAEGVDQKMRRLRKQPLSSHYWVRSSADGRYVGYGMNTSAKIVDLTKPESATAIKVAADYDPLFLPSNDGFAFAGAHTGNSIRLCRQSLLADVGGAANPSITLTESKCTNLQQQVYMSIGTALEGGRYFMTFGSHENDDGGNDIKSPLPAAFSASARTVFVPMVNDGLAYRAQPTIDVVLPHEGDMMLSPSSTLAATRFGNGTKQLGYRIRMITSAPGPDGGLGLETALGAELCLPGAKAGFSFDERFVVTHQYVDHSEPNQASLPEGSSNILIADLMTGAQVRITNSKAGEYALYPHFRADGWLYFVVRDMNESVEYVVATDVALRMPTP